MSSVFWGGAHRGLRADEGAAPTRLWAVNPIDHNGKVCYVISVPESEVTPHFLNGRKGVWIRTDEFSGRFDAQLANESELRSLFDRRNVILERRASLLERAQNRFDTYLTSARAQSQSPSRWLKIGFSQPATEVAG